MKTIMLCTALPVVVILALSYRELNLDQLGEIINVCLFLAMFGAFAGVIISTVIGYTLVPLKVFKTEPTRLTAMGSVNGVSGTFLFGSGNLSSELVYRFYEIDDDGSLVPGRVTASNAVHIIEDEELKDEGFWTTTTRERDRASPFFSWAMCFPPLETLLREEFRVPKGTVSHAFQLGVQ